MAARGGGRGGAAKSSRGYTPPSGAQLYLKRSAQECGLDDRNLRSLQDITMPALFPDLTWHSNGTIWRRSDEDEFVPQVATAAKRTSSTVYLIQKGRQVHTRMQTLYQMRPAQKEQDVVRYGTSAEETTKTNFAIQSPAYVPQELLQPVALPKKKSPKTAPEMKKKSKQPLNLNELEERERKRLRTGEPDAATTDASHEQTEEQSEEEEEAADYTMNYYESEGEESDGGGDGEPTF